MPPQVPCSHARRGLPSRPPGRLGVSELYASMLMLGVTITLGSVVTSMVANQFASTTAGAAAGQSAAVGSAGVQLSFVRASVPPSQTCPFSAAAREGTTLVLTIFDYGSSGFRPTSITVNATVYSSSGYPSVAPGAMATYRISLTPGGTCAHPWGQVVYISDAQGDGLQFET